MNGNGQLKRQSIPPPTPQPDPRRGIFVPASLAPETSERSLQINIDSEDDAKSVIQNLPAIKAAYDAAGVTSVEFCIAESVSKAVEHTLMGAIRWCRTYTKHISPQPGNVLFPLPAFVNLISCDPIAPLSPESSPPVNTPQPSPLVKPQRPVRAESAAK